MFDVFYVQAENIKPQKLAIDRPSHKFISFLQKHYGLKSTIPQVNNFVVFDGFFGNRHGMYSVWCLVRCIYVMFMFVSRLFITARKRGCRKVIFHRCLSVNGGGRYLWSHNLSGGWVGIPGVRYLGGRYTRVLHNERQAMNGIGVSIPGRYI